MPGTSLSAQTPTTCILGPDKEDTMKTQSWARAVSTSRGSPSVPGNSVVIGDRPIPRRRRRPFGGPPKRRHLLRHGPGLRLRPLRAALGGGVPRLPREELVIATKGGLRPAGTGVVTRCQPSVDPRGRRIEPARPGHRLHRPLPGALAGPRRRSRRRRRRWPS